MNSDNAPATSHHWLTKLGIKLYRLKTQAKRRWWVLLLTVSIGLAIEGWLIWSKSVEYESTGSLMVSGRVVGDRGYREEEMNFYGTTLKILGSPEVQDRTVRRLAIEYPKLSGNVQINAAVVPRTSIFNVSGAGANPEYTQRYVETLMEEFLRYKREKVNEAVDMAVQQMSEGLVKLKKEIAEREKDLHQFMEQNNMAFWEEESKNAARYLSELKTRQANLTNEKQGLENLSAEELLAKPNAPTTSKNSDSTPAEAYFGGDLTGQYLQKSQQLVQRKADLAEKSSVWKPKHPRLIAIKTEIADLERLLETIKGQMKDTAQARIVAIKAELKSLEASIQNWQEKVNVASRKDAEYQTLQGEVKRTQDSYDKLQSDILKLVQIKTTEMGSISMHEHASPPREVSREPVTHLLTGFALGLLVGLVIIYVLDRTDDTFSAATEVIEQFSEPILGQIPNVSNSRTPEGLPLIRPDDERYMYSEAFRSLRSSLVFMPNEGELKTLLVTSSIPGEGKSTIASNLSVTMAQAGARVLLVDADLRRGDLAGLFDVDGRFGLSNVLRNEVKWNSVVQATKYPTLSLIPRGPVTNQSGELLLVPFLESLLADFKNEYDLTIFNTPPVLATDDTATLAPNFDGTLMVMRAQFTSARLVYNTLNALYRRQVNVLGLILNCVDLETPDYYYHRYPKYYAA
jgi:polysaccharide biosynthesis transport protein